MNQQNEENKNYSGLEKLYDTEIGMPHYNSHIVKNIQKSFKAKHGDKSKYEVLDFGAGVGSLAKILKGKYLFNVECVEIDPVQQLELTRNGFINFSTLKDCGKKYKFIYSSNVLEHIEDDLGALKNLYESLEVGGVFVIYVPALPFLFSDFDKSVGHFRRYRRKSLEEKVKSAGFSNIKSKYCDSIGILGNLLVKIVGYDEVVGQNKYLLRIYDTYLFPISIIADIFLKKIMSL